MAAKRVLLVIGVIGLLLTALMPLFAFLIKTRHGEYLYAILLELSILIVPVILFRKHVRSYAIWIAIIGVVSIALTLAAYFFSIEIGASLLWLLYYTDGRESKELLSSYFFPLLAIYLTYFTFVTLIIRNLPRVISFRLSSWISCVALLSLVACGILSWTHPRLDGVEKSLTTYYPSSLYSITSGFISELNSKKEIELRVREHSYSRVERGIVNKQQVVVMVIGETSRGQNWSLGGYSRQTNPRLATRNGVVYYSNATTAGSQTAFALPLILTGADPQAYEECQYESGVLGLFDQAGFKTVWITNQLKGPAAANIAIAGSYHTLASPSDNLGRVGNGQMDMDLVGLMAEVLEGEEDDCLIVLHTMGSHYKYEMRYPRAYAKYGPTRKNFLAPVTARDRDELVNAYDNSILYTDAVLDSIAGMLSRTGVIGAMLYTSDHGENLYDDDRNMFGHASEPTEYTAKVPFLIYCNEEYISAYPEKWALLNEHRDQRVCNNQAFSTLRDMMAIGFEGQKDRNSIAAPGFKGSDQWIRGPGRVYSSDSLQRKPPANYTLQD